MGFFLQKKQDSSPKKTPEATKITMPQKSQQENTSHDDYSVATRRITCPSCSIKQDVPVIAISAFCKKCGVRINLQDYKKNDFFRGELVTKGTLFITATGEVKGNANVGDAVIDGKFDGYLIAEGVVKLMPGSQFFGEVHAPKIYVADGATFVGFSHIQKEEDNSL